MSINRSIKPLLPHLVKILEDADAYISHQTALFLLGFEKKPGDKITIVSSRRRRNRNLEGFEVVFVYHGNFDSKNLQLIDVCGFQLRVSSIEKTLADICKDLNYSPEIFRIADLFCSMPYDLKYLLNIAKNTSDTVCKRVSLMLAWSGRASFQDLPIKYFKRTPIKLDSRVSKDLIWNSLFYTKLPRKLLRYPVKSPPPDVDTETLHWMELKALPEFCQKQFEIEMIFIRNSPEPRIKKTINDYFVEIYKSLSKEKFLFFLEQSEKSSNFLHSIPFLLRCFLNQNNDVLLLRQKELENWVRKNLVSADPDRISSVIYYGIKLGLKEEVYEKFADSCTELFYAGKFEIINFFAKHYLNTDLKPNPRMLLNISKTWSAQEKFELALDVLENAKEEAENQNQSYSVIGQLHYATGLVFHRMERSDDALSELFLARECFLFDRNQEELSRTENSLGNIYFSRGHPRSAKSHYISGLQTAGSINNKHLQSSVLANIGLVEYDLGNFSKAMNYLNQSYLMNQMIKNHWTASVVGMALGKLQLRLGYFSKSMRIFREIMPIRQRKGNSSGIFEISSILAWICEIIGKSAAAGTYWNQTEKIQESELEPRSRFVGKLLRGMSNLFHCKFDTAYKLFDEMLEVARKRGASRLQCADCLQGLALSKFFQNRKTEALEFFKQALEHLGNDKDRFQYFQISYTASLLFPEQFKAIDFEKTIEKLIYSKIYDPLWVHFAPFLIANGSENAIKFLAFHVERLPHTALHKMEEIHPGLKDIIKIIQNKANRASQFVTLITPDETRTIHQDDYLKWRKKLPEDKLIFDGPAGTLIYNESKAIIKPGTIPHSILQQLFMAIPHPVEIESLYRSAWGMEFDPEFDFGAVKSSLQRLKSKLKRVVTAATLKRQKSAKGFKAVRLSVSVPWILVFR